LFLSQTITKAQIGHKLYELFEPFKDKKSKIIVPAAYFRIKLATASTCVTTLPLYKIANRTITGVNTHFLSPIFTSKRLNAGAKSSNIPSNLHLVLELLSQPSSPESILVHFEVAFSL